MTGRHQRSRLQVILLASATALVAGSPCPADWSQGGFWCYLLNSTSALSWAGADAFCQERGARLLVMPDRAHLLDVLDLLRGKAVSDWWIGIRSSPGDTHEQAISNAETFDNFGDDKRATHSYSASSYDCAYVSSRDGFWYWHTCDSAMNYICVKPASRVPIQPVSPERRRPSAAWFAAHAKNIEDALYTARVNSAMDDDKGQYSPSKVTMTPKPPLTTTAASVVPSGVTPGPGLPAEVTTVSLCGDWMMMDSVCYKLMLNAMNWTLADQFCQQQGGNLASFSSRDSQRLFVSRFSRMAGSVWIGLAQLDGGPIHWTDGTSATYLSWAAGQPTAAADPPGCGALSLPMGKWYRRDCAEHKPFVCRRSVGATTLATTSTEAPTSSAPSQCGAGGWWQYRQWCFLLVTDAPPVGWHAARQGCRRRGATLAKIDSSAENANIAHRVTQSNLPVWIGLSRLQPPHQYTWTDGSEPSFTSWEHGHNSVADMSSCARMDNEHSSWRAVNCNSPQYYVCQRPVGSPVSPLPPPSAPPAPSEELACPAGWTRYGADRCLLLSDRLADWSEARRICRNEAHEGELITIADAVQQAFVTDAIRDSTVPFWIGLTSIQLEQRFLTWTDESPLNYTNWAPGQPSNVCDGCPVTCGLLGSSRNHSPGAWSAVDCSHAFRFVCQRPALPSSRVAGGADTGPAERAMCSPPRSDYLADGGACWKVVRQPATWQAAMSACRAENSSLAYVADVFDNARLMKLLYPDGGDQFWLALSDTERYGIPQWSAPWPAEPTFTNWEPRPTALAAPASCAALQASSGRWRHLPCSQRRPYVCLWQPQAERALPSVAARCPSRQWAASDRRCYRLHENVQHTRTWAEAKRACEEQHQQLAVVSSEKDFLAVMEAVSSLTNTFSAWIGASRRDDGSFVWVDGTTVQFDGWIQGEPSPLHETCLEASKLNSGRWNNLRCNMYRPFVCMIEISENTPSSSASRQADDSSGGGWRVFGIVCLALVVLVTLISAIIWVYRRKQLSGRHQRLSTASSDHHSRENPAYGETSQPLGDSLLDGDGGGELNGATCSRWSMGEHEEHPL